MEAIAIPTTRFLGGWDVDFSDPVKTAAFLRLHGVGERGFEFFRTVQTALEVIIEEGGTAQCYDHCRDLSGDLFRTLRARNIHLPVIGTTTPFTISSKPRAARMSSGGRNRGNSLCRAFRT